MIDTSLNNSITTSIEQIPLPCIKNKCIVYPACKSKDTIESCKYFDDYLLDVARAIQDEIQDSTLQRHAFISVYDLFNHIKYINECDMLWIHLNKYFSNLSYITFDNLFTVKRYIDEGRNKSYAMRLI